jgi:hypothetical protein
MESYLPWDAPTDVVIIEWRLVCEILKSKAGHECND